MRDIVLFLFIEENRFSSSVKYYNRYVTRVY